MRTETQRGSGASIRLVFAMDAVGAMKGRKKNSTTRQKRKHNREYEEEYIQMEQTWRRGNKSIGERPSRTKNNDAGVPVNGLLHKVREGMFNASEVMETSGK